MPHAQEGQYQRIGIGAQVTSLTGLGRGCTAHSEDAVLVAGPPGGFLEVICSSSALAAGIDANGAQTGGSR